MSTSEGLAGPGEASFRSRRRQAARREVLDAAREIVADVGVERLALRAVARAVGMSPSALYEYVPSRDALLVELLTETYERLAAVLEDAGRDATTPVDRFLAVARAYRAWATSHREEFVLLYATRVPGLTIERGGPTTTSAARAGTVLRESIAALSGGPVPAPSDPRFLGTWAQMQGLVMLELFGHAALTGADPAALYEDVLGEVVERLTAG